MIVQHYFPFVFVPGTELAYPVSLTFKNILIVLLTVNILGGFTSAWATRNVKDLLG